MRWLVAFLLALTASVSAQPANPLVPAVEAEKKPSVLEKWGITYEQYFLIHPSRRPGGDTYKYWRERKRGPYGNLLERIPGGPRRPVKF